MPGDRDVQRLREQTVTLAELLRHHTDGWQPPQLGGQAIAQTHCHQHAIMGYDADQALLRDAGVDLDVLDAGCCGLAGNFGFEAGHYDVSLACGERSCSRPSATRPPTPWCWPTGSAAAPRSSRAAPAARPPTWPRYWPPGCAASRSARPAPTSPLWPTTLAWRPGHRRSGRRRRRDRGQAPVRRTNRLPAGK